MITYIKITLYITYVSGGPQSESYSDTHKTKKWIFLRDLVILNTREIDFRNDIKEEGGNWKWFQMSQGMARSTISAKADIART